MQHRNKAPSVFLYMILLLALVIESQETEESGAVQPPKYVQKLFHQHTYAFTRRDGSKSDALYSVFEPDSLESERKYPLLVWLHGAGQRSVNNTAQLRHVDETIMPRVRKEECPVFVLAPQCRPDIAWSKQDPTTGEQIGDEQKDMLAITNDLIDQLITKHPIDPNRIVIIGLSDGGNAAWEMAERYPDKFAAVMPFGSFPTPNLNLDKLRDVKIWAFHSPIDRAKPPDLVRNMVARLKAVGALVELTFACDNPSEDDEVLNHFCFRTPFEEYDLLSWIIAQNRSKSSPKPGIIEWSKRLRWAYLEPRLISATPFIVGAAIVVAILAEVQRRRHLMRGMNSSDDLTRVSSKFN